MMLTAQPYAGWPARNYSSSIILPLLFQFFSFSIYFPISHIFYIFFHKSLFRDCNWVDSHASWASGSHLHTLQHHSGGTQLVPSSEPQVNALHLRLYNLAKEIIDLAQVLKGLRVIQPFWEEGEEGSRPHSQTGSSLSLIGF